MGSPLAIAGWTLALTDPRGHTSLQQGGQPAARHRQEPLLGRGIGHAIALYPNNPLTFDSLAPIA